MNERLPDYYAVLGVPETATSSEIKSAYRKKAKELHPDVSKKESREFVILNEANATLSNPKKRAEYDEARRMTSEPSFGEFEGFEGFGGLDDLFAGFFGGRKKAGLARWQVGIQISPQEAIKGATRILRVGTEQVSLKIPPMSPTGRVVSAMTSDIEVEGVIEIVPGGGFRIEGQNLIYLVEIPDYLAALGGKIRVNGVSEGLEVQIPAGSGTGRRLRIKGMGLPVFPEGRGELLLEISIKVPKELTPAQREAYEKLRSFY